MFAASLACVFLPRNGAAGVKFFYTLADDGIWKAVNVRFGIIASCVVAVFALAGVAADFAGVKGLIYFSMAETAVYCLAALYAYVFARKLYFEKFPDSPRAGGRAAVGPESCAPGKLSGFERALFAFYILSTAALFFWLRPVRTPLGRDARNPLQFGGRGRRIYGGGRLFHGDFGDFAFGERARGGGGICGLALLQGGEGNFHAACVRAVFRAIIRLPVGDGGLFGARGARKFRQTRNSLGVERAFRCGGRRIFGPKRLRGLRPVLPLEKLRAGGAEIIVARALRAVSIFRV